MQCRPATAATLHTSATHGVAAAAPCLLVNFRHGRSGFRGGGTEELEVAHLDLVQGGGGCGNRSKQERGTKADWCQNNDEQTTSQSSKTTVVKLKTERSEQLSCRACNVDTRHICSGKSAVHTHGT